MPRKSYPSDLSDAEWKSIEPLLPQETSRGRPRTVNMREVLNGISYVLHSGCQWSMMPHDLPPYSTVYRYFQKLQRKGLWQSIKKILRHRQRKAV
ncbi:MAG: transposase [Cyanobacteria bacterium SID2]|nr:transposase [Cyanobacteria bacterium SID2]MBP0006746.1 transposase [Cyanobacteria bacterium SBC]